MKKNFIFIVIAIFILAGCKKDSTTDATKMLSVTAKVIDAETSAPLKDVVIELSSYDQNDWNGLRFATSGKTDSKGNVTLSLEDKTDFAYSMYLSQDFVEILSNNYINPSVSRFITDRFTNKRILNHTFRILKGRSIGFSYDSNAIAAKDSIELDIFQLKNNAIYTVAKGKYDLSFYSTVEKPYQRYYGGYIADVPIYINYRYLSKNGWQRDSIPAPAILQFGSIPEYQLKY